MLQDKVKPMEEISSSVAVPFTLGNLIQKESAVATHMEITGLKLMANTAAALILNPAVEGYSVGTENHSDLSLQHQITVSAEVKENQDGVSLVSEMVIECESNWVLSGSNNQVRDVDEFMLTEIDTPIIIKVDDNMNIHGKFGINDLLPALNQEKNIVSIEIDLESEHRSRSGESDTKLSDMVLDQLPKENNTTWRASHNALELSSGPLWGFSSICGSRHEMEDAVSVKTQLFQVPSQMLMDDHMNKSTNISLAHFFGVYDGHGGFQVCLNQIVQVVYLNFIYFSERVLLFT